MNVEREEQTGRIVTQVGSTYAALRVIVFGGRLAFAWAASHVWPHQVALFSIQHEIIGSTAWTAAFVFMALSMVLTRTVVDALRALLIERSFNLNPALESWSGQRPMQMRETGCGGYSPTHSVDSAA
jgi:hypothetical protein